MDSVVVRDAAEASTFCAGNVVGVQRDAMSLLPWKQVPTPPFGQMVRTLSQRLDDLLRATGALDDSSAGIRWRKAFPTLASSS